MALWDKATVQIYDNAISSKAIDISNAVISPLPITSRDVFDLLYMYDLPGRIYSILQTTKRHRPSDKQKVMNLLDNHEAVENFFIVYYLSKPIYDPHQIGEFLLDPEKYSLIFQNDSDIVKLFFNWWNRQTIIKQSEFIDKYLFSLPQRKLYLEKRIPSLLFTINEELQWVDVVNLLTLIIYHEMGLLKTIVLRI